MQDTQMISSYSKEFLESVDSSNLEIANNLLGIFNAALYGIRKQEDMIILTFKRWGKNGVTEDTFLKSFVVHSNNDHLVKRIITECDLDAYTRDTVQDELRVTVEKYALKDFIKLTIDEFNRKELEIRDQVQVQIVLDPIDATLIVNDAKVSTINGVFSAMFFEGEPIAIKATKDGYRDYESSLEASSTVINVTLEQVKYNVHFALFPEDALITLYKGKVQEIQDLYDSEHTQLTDLIPAHSLADDLFTLNDGDRIDLTREQDMYLTKLPFGEYTVKAECRLFKSFQETFTLDDNLFKSIHLKPYFVEIRLDVDPVFQEAYTSINGKSVELPYTFKMAVGESALIESRYKDLEYRNYIIANEADIRTGLDFTISFIRKFTLDLRVPDGASLFVNNMLQGVPYFSGEFTQGSRVDVQVKQEGYVPISETFYMMRDIQKIYELEERLPMYTLKYSVTPESAYVTVNGMPVANPYEMDFIEGSEVHLRATKENYIAFSETVIMHQNEERNIILEQYEMFKPTVKITCDVPDAICFINDQEIELPVNLTVEQGSRLKVNIHAEGYKDHDEIIEVKNQDITRDIHLEEMTEDELQDLVNIVINVNRINSIVMLNNKQIDGEIVYSDEGEIVNYVFKTQVPRGTYCQLQVTNPGYYPYFETFVPDMDFERDVILSKEPQYKLYRVNVFSRTAGSILEVNDKIVSSPYVHDVLEGSDIKVRCHLDGYVPYEYVGKVDRDLIISIELNKEDENESGF